MAGILGGRLRGSACARRGMAVPLAFAVLVMLGVFLGIMTYNRLTMKRQTKTTFEYLRAYYMAQGGLQHALLKLRVLPNEAYDASCISTGVCPFFTGESPGHGDSTDDLWKVYMQEICTDKEEYGPGGADFLARHFYPLKPPADSGIDPAFWGYCVDLEKSKALSLYTNPSTRERVMVLELTIRGWGPAFAEGVSAKRFEIVKKIVEIKTSF